MPAEAGSSNAWNGGRGGNVAPASLFGSTSSALLLEHRRDKHELRRALTGNVLALASEVVSMDASVASRAELYRRMGLEQMDAAHLACVVECGVDFFCTCDDRLLRRAKRVDTGLTRPVTLLELLEEVER